MQNDIAKLVLSEILQGHSSVKGRQFEFFIKHLTPLDFSDLEGIYQEYLKETIKQGIPNREEREKTLIDSGLWTPEKTREILDLESFIKNLLVSKNKHVVQKMKDEVQYQIDESQKKYTELMGEKLELFSKTAEDYADRKKNDYFLFISAFRDRGLTERLFTDKTFGELENDDFSELIGGFNEKLSQFNEKNIKRAALLPQFLNPFCLSGDNPYFFYGRPIMGLSNYQIDIFSYGRYFKHIFAEHGDKIPAEYKDDPDKIIEIHEGAKSAEKLMNKTDMESKGGATTVPGAKNDDYNKMGLQSDKVSLFQKAKASGGKLNMAQLAELHGA